jgi:hypothetical protein
MDNHVTPELELHCENALHPIPNKAKLQAVVEFNHAHAVKYRKIDLYSYFKVPERTGRCLLSSNRHFTSARRFYNNPTMPETRGQKAKITKEQIKRMDQFLQTQRFEGRILTWQQLAAECKVEDVSEQTIQRAIGNSIYYSTCIACTKA